MAAYDEILKDSDNGVWPSELLDFWTSSIVRYSKPTSRKPNLFLSSDEGVRDALSWCPLYRAWSLE
jgi:hypothetical protein